MEILYDEEMHLSDEILSYMTRAAEICVLHENLDPEKCEISFSYVDEETIRRLNRDYRGNDKITDVLSFPQFDDLDEAAYYDEICLGDVVICDAVAKRQAEEYGHSYERETIYLFVHSVHHLLGYDHMEEEEKKIMRGREEAVMKELGLER